MRKGIKAGRATFAEGLASSYEAFLETRPATGRPAKMKKRRQRAASSDQLVSRYVSKLAAAAFPDEAA